MYVVTIGPRSETRTTLAGVLQLLNDDRGELAAPRAEDIAVRHVERGEIPVVAVGRGRLGVRPPGTPRIILSKVIEEVDQFIVRVGGKVLRPHEMSRSSWGAVVAAGRLAYFPEEAVDTASGDAGPLFQTADLFEETGPFDTAAFIHAEFARRFGYGTNGPAYDSSQSPNQRHEVHVAYALLRGLKVRECVLNTYRDNPSHGRFDLEWMHDLIAVPALRGALSPAHLIALCQVMRAEKLPITASNAPKLIAILCRLPVHATRIHIDDALFEAGILPPRTAAMSKRPEGEDARPVSPLADRIHHLITQRQFNETMDRAKGDREAMRITQRHFDDTARRAVNLRTSTGFAWANKVALSVLQRDIGGLLKVFDNPKDWNADSKRAVRDILGVELMQCTAAVRRQRIFELCGFSAAEQTLWEEQAAADEAVRAAARELEEARKLAESARLRLEDGKVLNGREYVDFCIADGYSQIIDRPRGRAREYFIHDARRGYSRPLRAKNGTLSYARARLAQDAAQIAMAA